MRRSVVLIGLSILILAFGFMMFSGCAKKVVKEAEEEKTTTVQKEAAPAAPAAPAETEEQRLAREKALREAALKEQQEKERMLAEQKAKEALAAAIAEIQDIHFDFGDSGFGDIFGQFFGGNSSRQGPKRGRDVEATLQLSFEEAVFGVEEKIKIEMNDECSHCHGTTLEPGYEMKTCPTCKGAGQVNRIMNTIFGPIQQSVTCETCDGRGKIPEKVCSVCRGKGVERREKTINLKFRLVLMMVRQFA